MLDKRVEDIAVLDFNPMLVCHTKSGLSASLCHLALWGLRPCGGICRARAALAGA
jgi:hypothetical protein